MHSQPLMPLDLLFVWSLVLWVLTSKQLQENVRRTEEPGYLVESPRSIGPTRIQKTPM
jgi:hypothetical protein